MSLSAASTKEFKDLLVWSYRGEVAGETLFAGLAAGFAETGHRMLFERLAELERLMADALRPELHRYGISGGDDARSRTRGDANAAAVLDAGWEAFLHQFEPITEDALRKYREATRVAGNSDDAIWDLLIAHENAIQAAGRRLNSDEDGDPSELVTEVIGQLASYLDGT